MYYSILDHSATLTCIETVNMSLIMGNFQVWIKTLHMEFLLNTVSLNYFPSFVFNYVYVGDMVQTRKCRCLQKSEENTESPEARVTGASWELNPTPLWNALTG